MSKKEYSLFLFKATYNIASFGIDLPIPKGLHSRAQGKRVFERHPGLIVNNIAKPCKDFTMLHFMQPFQGCLYAYHRVPRVGPAFPAGPTLGFGI